MQSMSNQAGLPASTTTSTPLPPGSIGMSVTPTTIIPAHYSTAYVAESPIQRAAIELYDLGFNIGPTKPADKLPFRWRVLVGTRISRGYILPLFDNGVGIFVLTGRLSMNLTILDCDTETEAKRQAQEFKRRDLRPWRVNTARGAHFWWLSADGEIANIQADDCQVWGNMHYCLCPPSIHPTGMIYEWAERNGTHPPMISIAALDWLPVKLCAEKRRKFDPNLTTVDPLVCLSKRNRDFVANGAPETTRNNRLFAAACDMAGNGIALDEAIDILITPAQKSGLSYNEIVTTIKSAYSQERTPSRQIRTDSKPLTTWMRAQLWAMSRQWEPMHITWTNPKNGKIQNVSVTAQTAHDVFLALCERSRRDSADVFRASRREISELANVDRMTAHRAILCLLSTGFVLSRGYTANSAALFAFGGDVLRHTYSNPHWSDHSVTKSSTRSDARADVFRHGALGKTAERVWLSIRPPNSPATKAEIARRAKCSSSTVTRLLSADGLPKWGLVSQFGDDLWIGNPADDRYLFEVAVKSGTAGKAAQRRQQHAAEREVYAARMILRAKRSWERKHLGKIS